MGDKVDHGRSDSTGAITGAKRFNQRRVAGVSAGGSGVEEGVGDLSIPYD